MSNPYPPGNPQEPTQAFDSPGYGQQVPQQPYRSPDYPPAPDAGYPPAQGGQAQQPGYGRATVPPPSWGQGGYDQGGYGYGGPPVAYEPEPRRKRKVWPIVLIVLVIVLGLLGATTYLIGKPYLTEYPATLTLPDTILGHERSTDPQLRAAADQAVAELRREIDLQEAVAEFYQHPDNELQIIWLIGGTKFIMNPGAEIDAAFRGAGASGDFTMSSPSQVDPGPLGGIARCSTAKVADTGDLQITICAWADHGALVIVMFFNRSIDEGADLMRQIRAQIQSR